MGYVIAGMVIAIGITLMVAGVSGSGSQLFQGLTGRAPSGKSQSSKLYANTAQAAGASVANGGGGVMNV